MRRETPVSRGATGPAAGNHRPGATPRLPHRSGRVAVVVLVIALVAIALAPLRVVSLGYLPGDDALRHAAKVMAGKSWREILVLDRSITVDTHPGWHTLLAIARFNFGLDADGLVVLQVVLLFVWFGAVPMVLLRRPEAWLAVLLLVVLTTDLTPRLMLGRPFILTMGSLAVWMLIWPRMERRPFDLATILVVTCTTALSTWCHNVFFLFVLPWAAFVLARRWRMMLVMGGCLLAGIGIGAVLSGHPAEHLQQNLWIAVNALDGVAHPRMLAREFQPGDGAPLFVLAWLLICLCRRVILAQPTDTGDEPLLFDDADDHRDAPRQPATAPSAAPGVAEAGTDRAPPCPWRMLDRPDVVLGWLGWVLGFISWRFWADWGLPALAAAAASNLDLTMRHSIDGRDPRRVMVALVLGVSLVLAVGSDQDGRWTRNLAITTPDQHAPELAGWLPDKGGVLYNDTMGLFYRLFFRNPRSDWRYAVGFEPAMMDPELRGMLRQMQWHHFSAESYAGWVSKLRPADRLAIEAPPNRKPEIAGLEWQYFPTHIWLGRLPRGTSPPGCEP